MNQFLILDKDPKSIELFKQVLEGLGFHLDVAQEDRSLYEKIGKNQYTAVFIDLSSVAGRDIDVISFIHERQPSGSIVVLASIEEIDSAVAALRRGAYLYLIKPLAENDIRLIVQKMVQKGKEMYALKEFEKRIFLDLIGPSKAMKKVYEMVVKVAPTDGSMLITGETGTGKEIIAKLVHSLSQRNQGPFVAVNCGAIPENLFESELFGHVKGSFTGANSDKKGLIEMAHQGTLFLDEIGELSLSLQIKLLRVLQDREIRALGETVSKKVDIRLITATNTNLIKAIEEKKFREDLFYRLNVIHIFLPPLRERKESLISLMKYFLANYNKVYQKNIDIIDEDVLYVLNQYRYPGNIRELENIIQHCAIMSDGERIKKIDLPEYLQQEVTIKSLPMTSSNEMLTLRDLERNHILAAMEKYEKNQTKVAKILNISRSTLWRKLKEHEIQG